MSKMLKLALLWCAYALSTGERTPYEATVSNLTTQLEEVKLGVLLPSRPISLSWTMQRVIPALRYAIRRVDRLGILPGKLLTVNYSDSLCSEILAPVAAIDMFVHSSAHVFIGPACDFAVAPVAQYSFHWKIPLLTSGALVSVFRNKTQFQLLTRMSGGYSGLGTAFYDIMRHYGWKNVGFPYREAISAKSSAKSFYFFICQAMLTTVRQKARSGSWGLPIMVPVTDEAIDDLLRNVSIRARIVVLCASGESVRKIMLKAAEMNFNNGEYVFFNIDLFSSMNETRRPWYRPNDTDENNAKARRAYEMLLTITVRKPTSGDYRNFSESVKARANTLYGNFTYGEEEVNSYVGAFHDAVILYALALNETLEAGGNVTDGIAITKRMWNRTFEGITGTVSIDANGDRNADYSLLDMNNETGDFEVVGNYFGNMRVYQPLPGKVIHWGGGRTVPPPDKPKCGYDGSECPPDKPFPMYAIVIIILGSLLIFVLITSFFVYRHYRLEAQLASMNWRIRWEDIMFGTLERHRAGSRKISVASSASGDTMAVHLSDVGNKQLFTQTGYYKGTIVAIKKIKKAHFTINKPVLMEIKRVKDLQNDHICRFIGSCIDAPHQCIVTEYCQKGSLQDVLENEQLKLDWMFRYSLIQDIVRGMAYIHNSEIRSHGNLKSSNCVVDSRFVLKITDFSLHFLRDEECDEEANEFAAYHRKLWRAPELLRLHGRHFEGTQKGDVYSFAIICQEIVYRGGVFYLTNLDFTPKEIYQRVKNGAKPHFRPTLESDDCPTESFCDVIRKCWAEEPPDRPDFTELKSIIRKLNRDGDKGNILDNLLCRMEQYANNLESLVEERTADYLEEKKKAENLLYLMLPKTVAGQLIQGETVQAEAFESVTIYFSDICGFTALSAACTPMEVVDLLNDLYTHFDSIIDNYDVYKVETIGDAYMVVSGLPVRNGIQHSAEIARMSLALLNAVRTFRIRHRPNEQLKLRIGLHTGPVCAGVVGHKMPRYCLFGDTVNTASRMESNGQPLQIHISSQTKDLLDQIGNFKTELRGDVEMKGKGKLTTYWLLGEIESNYSDNNLVIV